MSYAMTPNAATIVAEPATPHIVKESVAPSRISERNTRTMVKRPPTDVTIGPQNARVIINPTLNRQPVNTMPAIAPSV